MTPRFPDRAERAQTPAASHRSAAAGTRVPPRIAHKILAAQRREQMAILAELVKIRGFMPLLMKHRNGAVWSRAERVELHEQLRAMAHLSPYLFIMILPGSFVLLPVFAWWLDRRRQDRAGRVAAEG
ncbi:MAG: hypothetical protein PHY45_16460 [Rhodocyclaceae bacterium]|nr:hypothetical protein [Rhodocyclaceae bacterium]